MEKCIIVFVKLHEEIPHIRLAQTRAGLWSESVPFLRDTDIQFWSPLEL